MTNPYEPPPRRDWYALGVSAFALLLCLACLYIIATN